MNDMKYTTVIAEQLSELRDLLIVIERGGDKSPDVLYKLAIEKSAKITSLVEQWREDAAPEPVTIPAEYAEWVDGKTEEEVTADVPADNTVEFVDMSKDPFVPVDVDEEEDENTDDTNDENVIAIDDIPSVADDECNEDEEEEYIAPFVEDEDSVSTVSSDESTQEIPIVEFSTDIPVIEVVTDDEDSDDGEDVQEDKSTPVFVDDEVDEQQVYNMGEPLENDEDTTDFVTVGDMMSVRKAKELRKALNLNDRFRFRRELFGNSDVKMTETLALLDTMESYSEACEYLTQDLGWNTEDPVAQEFLSLVERHFKS